MYKSVWTFLATSKLRRRVLMEWGWMTAPRGKVDFSSGPTG